MQLEPAKGEIARDHARGEIGLERFCRLDTDLVLHRHVEARTMFVLRHFGADVPLGIAGNAALLGFLVVAVLGAYLAFGKDRETAVA